MLETAKAVDDEKADRRATPKLPPVGEEVCHVAWLFWLLLVLPVVLALLRYHPRTVVYRGEATAILGARPSHPEKGFSWVLFSLPGGSIVGADIPVARLRKLPAKNTLVDVVVVCGATGSQRVESVKWCDKRGFEPVADVGDGAMLMVILWVAFAGVVACTGAYSAALIYLGAAAVAWLVMSARRAAAVAKACACKDGQGRHHKKD